MIVNSYTFEPISSIMYIIIENNEALVIDPNISDEAFRLLSESGVSKVLILLTHEHCDHITGVNWFREHFETTVLCSEKCAENIEKPDKNFSQYFDVLLMGKNTDLHMKPFSCSADKTFRGDVELHWNGHKLYLRECPGHSEGSICIILDDMYAFTGDYLIPNQKVFTNIPGGNKKIYNETTVPYLVTLNKFIIMPGHV